MPNSRASVFGEDSELDLSGFKPKPKPETKAPAAEAVKAVSETANFRSREAVPVHPASAPSLPKRPARRFRTGRNVQFNIKALQETVDAFYKITEENNWVLGYTLERAIAALQHEMETST